MQPELVQDLNLRVADCNACRLCETRTRTVPGSGDPGAELMLIGEGPGFHEDQQGVPFVGRAGGLLDECLAHIGLDRSRVFVTNVVKCRPPNNRDPMPDEIEACEVYLAEQLHGIRPKLIVTLGRFATQYFLPGATMSRTRGQVINAAPWRVLPVYHPAAALRNPKLRGVLFSDFEAIPALLAESARPDPLAPAAGAPAEPQPDASQPSLL